jgi:hypothetical protein
MVGTGHFAVLSELPYYAILSFLNGIIKISIRKAELRNIKKEIFFFLCVLKNFAILSEFRKCLPFYPGFRYMSFTING